MSAALDPERAGSWCDRAACRGRTELMFATDQLSERLALALCRSCPVQPQCLADARSTEAQGQRHGVVAGYLPEQRRSWTTSAERSA